MIKVFRCYKQAILKKVGIFYIFNNFKEHYYFFGKNNFRSHLRHIIFERSHQLVKLKQSHKGLYFNLLPHKKKIYALFTSNFLSQLDKIIVTFVYIANYGPLLFSFFLLKFLLPSVLLILYIDLSILSTYFMLSVWLTDYSLFNNQHLSYIQNGQI